MYSKGTWRNYQIHFKKILYFIGENYFTKFLNEKPYSVVSTHSVSLMYLKFLQGYNSSEPSTIIISIIHMSIWLITTTGETISFTFELATMSTSNICWVWATKGVVWCALRTCSSCGCCTSRTSFCHSVLFHQGACLLCISNYTFLAVSLHYESQPQRVTQP
jgi:hypothetical protein